MATSGVKGVCTSWLQSLVACSVCHGTQPGYCAKYRPTCSSKFVQQRIAFHSRMPPAGTAAAAASARLLLCYERTQGCGALVAELNLFDWPLSRLLVATAAQCSDCNVQRLILCRNLLCRQATIQAVGKAVHAATAA